MFLLSNPHATPIDPDVIWQLDSEARDSLIEGGDCEVEEV